MKKTFVLAALLVIAATVIATPAQSVRVTKKTVTYTRPKARAKFKKTFIIEYPKVSGTSAALARKIENTIGLLRNLDLNIKEALTGDDWLESAGFEVKYNKNWILTVQIGASGSGAYPSGFSELVNVDLKTGNRIKAAQLLTDLPALAELVASMQKTEIANAIAEIREQGDYEGDPEELFTNADFTAKNLESFSVSDEGVTFHYDYEFPHVIQALQPDGQYLVTWQDLKPFIREPGLLGVFVR